ncbi:MAG: endonuclease [bacterium]|nr:endonuclease [bacterium]
MTTYMTEKEIVRDTPAASAAPVARLRRTRAETRARRERATERRDALSAAIPYLAAVRAPTLPLGGIMGRDVSVASYNVHRWAGLNGARGPDPARAGFVISELEADIIGLQEVLRPFDAEEDPLERLADALHLHLAFVATRVHRRGEIGNAILSRWPITSVFSLDLSFSRVEKRSAVAVEFASSEGPVAVVATHLALVDRTRSRQVKSILDNPRLQGPVILLGDMNAWRKCKATRTLERELIGDEEMIWPRTFPAARPVLALDRVYARGARIAQVVAHESAAARKASDHLPVIAQLEIEGNGLQNG